MRLLKRTGAFPAPCCSRSLSLNKDELLRYKRTRPVVFVIDNLVVSKREAKRGGQIKCLGIECQPGRADIDRTWHSTALNCGTIETKLRFLNHRYRVI